MRQPTDVRVTDDIERAETRVWRAIWTALALEIGAIVAAVTLLYVLPHLLGL